LSAINIQESSPAPGPDIFNIPVGATASSITGTNLVLDQQSLTIGFQANLGSVSDLLQGVMTFGPAGSFQSISVTGSADPIGVRPFRLRSRFSEPLSHYLLLCSMGAIEARE
jgi:hypothetical protein